MVKLVQIFFIGMLISFLGSLPLGTINIAAMQIAISDGVEPAMLFALGALTIEIIYVRFSVTTIDWIRRHKQILKTLEWITLLIVTALAAASFYGASHPHMHKNVILSSISNHYLLGLSMNAVNPMQIPFWFGWSTVLFTKKILLPQNSHYNTYISGIGLGTFGGSCVFIFGGKLIGSAISDNQNIVNWIIGGIFTVTAVIQLWKILKHKDAEHQVEHPEELQSKFEHTFEEIQKTSS